MNALAVLFVIVVSASCRAADLSRYGYDYGQSSGTNNEGYLNVDPGSAYGPAPYVPAQYGPAPYVPAPYVPAQYGPAPYVPAQYGPAPYVPAPFAPSPYSPFLSSEKSKPLGLNALLGHQNALLGAQNAIRDPSSLRSLGF